MDTSRLFDTNRRICAAVVLLACLMILIGAVAVASLVQRGFGDVEVTNVTYPNFNGILFVGPGGVLASFVMSIFHIIGVSIMTTPISTWFYQLTGKIYLGALVNAALVTWMFTSSKVIAPIPV